MLLLLRYFLYIISLSFYYLNLFWIIFSLSLILYLLVNFLRLSFIIYYYFNLGCLLNLRPLSVLLYFLCLEIFINDFCLLNWRFLNILFFIRKLLIFNIFLRVFQLSSISNLLLNYSNVLDFFCWQFLISILLTASLLLKSVGLYILSYLIHSFPNYFFKLVIRNLIFFFQLSSLIYFCLLCWVLILSMLHFGFLCRMLLISILNFNLLSRRLLIKICGF